MNRIQRIWGKWIKEDLFRLINDRILIHIMNPFRANKNWLRYSVISKMKENHKDLFDPFHKSVLNNFVNFISESNHWWVVFLSVAAIFIISPFINISFLNFLEIKPQTAIYIVDQRTANIAAIISITLVVVGFILTNLADKSQLVYRLLFQRSLLFPIIYLTLSTIACFIVTSTLRDTIPENDFSKIVLTGTYLSFLILFSIGFLFRIIFQFSNEKTISRMFDEELMREAFENTRQILLRRHSEEEFMAFMKKKGAKSYDWTEAFDLSNPQIEVTQVDIEDVLFKQSKEKVISDINLNMISKFISQKKPEGKLYFNSIGLESSVENVHNLIWEHGKSNSKKEKQILKNSIKLKSKKKNQRDNYEIRKYFDQKLEELSEQSNFRDLEPLLNCKQKLQMHRKWKIRVHRKWKQQCTTFVFSNVG